MAARDAGPFSKLSRAIEMPPSRDHRSRTRRPGNPYGSQLPGRVAARNSSREASSGLVMVPS